MPVQDSGPLHDATVASASEWTSTNWTSPKKCSGVTLKALSARGGTLDVDAWVGGLNNGGYSEIQAVPVTADTLTVVNFNYNIERGQVRFTPADATSGRTRVQIAFSSGE